MKEVTAEKEKKELGGGRGYRPLGTKYVDG